MSTVKRVIRWSLVVPLALALLAGLGFNIWFLAWSVRQWPLEASLTIVGTLVAIVGGAAFTIWMMED